MTVRVRFAPSPTGKLHIGNIRTALMNALYAKRNGGVFVLRFEDTDFEREVRGAESQMLDDMAWLGMSPDEGPHKDGGFGPYYTMQRAERGDYKEALEKLFADGRAYECFVTKDELDLMRKIQSSQGKPPHYDNRHRNLTEAEKDAFRAEGRESVIRFKLNEGKIHFDDMVRGTVEFDAANLGGDPVIIRSNGVPIFAFGGAVDDVNQKITHVIRGEDHVTNTAIQVQIFEALGGTVPIFAHMPMLAAEDGSKLSKRLDSFSLQEMRAEGYHPLAILNYIASLGFSDMPKATTVEELSQQVDISKMGRSTVRLDVSQLKKANAHILHELSYEGAKPFLAAVDAWKRVPEDKKETFWMVVRGNIERFDEIDPLVEICFAADMASPALEADDKSYIEAAVECLPASPYTEATWQEWTGTLKEKTSRKGKALFMPLRLALTGMNHGPELADLMPVIGEKLTKKRLQSAAKGV
mgnify:CR=1 FL=1